MWPDNETDEDLLGFEIHANLLQSIVTDPTMLPVTVGLFGDWGGGKSSILKILQRDLAPKDPDNPENLVIYFDTWVFQGYEDAKTAILAVLLQELKEHRAFKSKISDEATELLRRVNWMKVAKVHIYDLSILNYVFPLSTTLSPAPLPQAGEGRKPTNP